MALFILNTVFCAFIDFHSQEQLGDLYLLIHYAGRSTHRPQTFTPVCPLYAFYMFFGPPPHKTQLIECVKVLSLTEKSTDSGLTTLCNFCYSLILIHCQS